MNEKTYVEKFKIRVFRNSSIVRETCAICGNSHKDSDLFWFFAKRLTDTGPYGGDGTLCFRCARDFVPRQLLIDGFQGLAAADWSDPGRVFPYGVEDAGESEDASNPWATPEHITASAEVCIEYTVSEKGRFVNVIETDQEMETALCNAE